MRGAVSHDSSIMLQTGGSEYKRMPGLWARVASAARAAYLKPCFRPSEPHAHMIAAGLPIRIIKSELLEYRCCFGT